MENKNNIKKISTISNKKMEGDTMAIKHYNRFQGFIRYDIEERDSQEQKIILEQIIKVATDMLNKLETK